MVLLLHMYEPGYLWAPETRHNGILAQESVFEKVCLFQKGKS